MNVGELMKFLAVCDQDAPIKIKQPRHWVKKQPDMKNTSIISVEVNASVGWVTLKTGDF